MLDIVDEQLDVTGRGLLGLTVGCARCHDHKFDPIPTVDYYALAGIFRSTRAVSRTEDAQRHDVVGMSAVPGARRTSRSSRVDGARRKASRRPARPRRAAIGLHAGPDACRAASCRSSPASNRRRPSPPRQQRPAGAGPWIASSDNPLTARVMVNRIWQHHFGTRPRRHAATTSASAANGPSHPELLDWLAARFVDERLVGQGDASADRAVEQPISMASTADADAAADRPRQSAAVAISRRRRLEAEELRDAMLAVSGQLDRTIGGGEQRGRLRRRPRCMTPSEASSPTRCTAIDPFYTRPAAAFICRSSATCCRTCWPCSTAPIPTPWPPSATTRRCRRRRCSC